MLSLLFIANSTGAPKMSEKKKCKMTAGKLQHIFLAMCYNFLTLLVVWQTSQRQNQRRKWRGCSLAPNLQCVVFTLSCGYKKMKQKNALQSFVPFEGVQHPPHRHFLVFGQLLYEVNWLAWCLPITESLAPLLWRVSPLYLCFVMQRQVDRASSFCTSEIYKVPKEVRKKRLPGRNTGEG